MKRYLLIAVTSALVGVMLALAQGMVERVMGQTNPPAATLTENEELKLVNTYQAAIIAQVDYQTAKQRVEKASTAYSAVVAKVREDHKWSDATTFEINAETGKVTVHLPAANPKPEVKK